MSQIGIGSAIKDVHEEAYLYSHPLVTWFENSSQGSVRLVTLDMS